MAQEWAAFGEKYWAKHKRSRARCWTPTSISKDAAPSFNSTKKCCTHNFRHGVSWVCCTEDRNWREHFASQAHSWQSSSSPILSAEILFRALHHAQNPSTYAASILSVWWVFRVYIEHKRWWSTKAACRDSKLLAAGDRFPLSLICQLVQGAEVWYGNTRRTCFFSLAGAFSMHKVSPPQLASLQGAEVWYERIRRTWAVTSSLPLPALSAYTSFHRRNLRTIAAVHNEDVKDYIH